MTTCQFSSILLLPTSVTRVDESCREGRAATHVGVATDHVIESIIAELLDQECRLPLRRSRSRSLWPRQPRTCSPRTGSGHLATRRRAWSSGGGRRFDLVRDGVEP